MPIKRLGKSGRPKAIVPSKDDRRRVEIGIGGGLSAAALARLFKISRRTFNRVFADEVASGRARVIVEMGLCLYKAAQAGSAAAAKGLLGFIERSVPAEPEVPPLENRWEGLAERMHDEVLPESGKLN
jgi:hypothetical protein